MLFENSAIDDVMDDNVFVPSSMPRHALSKVLTID